MQDNQRQTHWAYIAGILDADGCFMISKHSRKSEYESRKWKLVPTWAPTYMPSIKIAMVEIEAIEFIIKQTGYGHYNVNGARKGRPNSKPIYHWYLRSRKNVIPFLNEVIPFLLVKKERAKFLLDFCNTFKEQNCRGVLPEELNYREQSYVKMRGFNGNKVAATTKFCGLERASDSLNS